MNDKMFASESHFFNMNDVFSSKKYNFANRLDVFELEYSFYEERRVFTNKINKFSNIINIILYIRMTLLETIVQHFTHNVYPLTKMI